MTVGVVAHLSEALAKAQPVPSSELCFKVRQPPGRVCLPLCPAVRRDPSVVLAAYHHLSCSLSAISNYSLRRPVPCRAKLIIIELLKLNNLCINKRSCVCIEKAALTAAQPDSKVRIVKARGRSQFTYAYARTILQSRTQSYQFKGQEPHEHHFHQSKEKSRDDILLQELARMNTADLVYVDSQSSKLVDIYLTMSFIQTCEPSTLQLGSLYLRSILCCLTFRLASTSFDKLSCTPRNSFSEARLTSTNFHDKGQLRRGVLISAPPHGIVE